MLHPPTETPLNAQQSNWLWIGNWRCQPSSKFFQFLPISKIFQFKMSFNNCFECLSVFQLKHMKFLQIYFQQISQKYFTRCALHTLDSSQNPLNFTNSILTYLSYSLLSQKFWPSHMYDCLRETVLINIYVYMCMYNMYLYIVCMYDM